MKAVFLDYATLGAERLDPSPLVELLPGLVLHDYTGSSEVAGRIAGAEAVFVNKVRLPADSLRTAGSLRYIGVAATGTDNVDLDCAAERGIAVTNVRAYCTQSVVEHVFGSLIGMAHSLARYRQATAAGEWQHARIFCLLDHPVRELSSMTMGIVGYGTLGRAVAGTAEHFGMRVLVGARPGGDTRPDRVPLQDLFRECDVISLHCPLTGSTRGLVGADELALMKRDAILVNTARGALVDSAALVTALGRQEIGGAIIDVLSEEPPASGDPLLDYRGDNLWLTPHIAWATETARQNAIDELAKNLSAFQDGELRNRVDRGAGAAGGRRR